MLSTSLQSTIVVWERLTASPVLCERLWCSARPLQLNGKLRRKRRAVVSHNLPTTSQLAVE